MQELRVKYREVEAAGVISAATCSDCGAMTPSAEAPGEGRLPDFFVGSHAEVGDDGALRDAAPTPADLHARAERSRCTLATDLRLRFQRPAAGPLPTELSEYLPLFADAAAGQLVGEASSSYLWSAEAAANIAAVRPQAKFIFILREPAAFLRSLHLQLLQNHVESEKDLRRALALEPAAPAGKADTPSLRPGPRRCCTPTGSATSSSSSAFTPRCRPSSCSVLIYDDFPARTTRRPLRSVLRHLGARRHRAPGSRRKKPTRR